MVQTSTPKITNRSLNAGQYRGRLVFMHRLAAGKDVHEQAVYGAMGNALEPAAVMTALIFMAVMYLVTAAISVKRIRKDRTGRGSWTGSCGIPFWSLPLYPERFHPEPDHHCQPDHLFKDRDRHGTDDRHYDRLRYFSNKAVVITNSVSIATAVAAAIIPNISSAMPERQEETRRRVIAAVRSPTSSPLLHLGLIALARPVTAGPLPQWESWAASALLACWV